MAKGVRHAPATTPEEREQQMIAYAVDMAEEQLLNRTASSAVLVHYLKLGASKTELEKEKLRRENDLLEAKTEQVHSSQRVEELYSEAIAAFRGYNGFDEEDEDL